ncbi:unnamed protein product [Didymodactylos carnosus]|uniref:Uncharacterized protein n=1 Tax=Didymodactylos carnosus TaxID=1234261 RepID=A0A816E3U2_9BILA|nr:unnamed protein product [Didymodactylos carnosus]CAF4554608.1 unnamed protein product [Didymodactylos carnosus]
MYDSSRKKNTAHPLNYVHLTNSRKTVNDLETQLMNIDMTVGLFLDEILAIVDESPDLLATLSSTLLDDVGKQMTNLMY